jgi:predicted GNAT superfamily acetyltransferase
MAPGSPDIAIRAIAEPAEMRVVEELQRDVWGFSDQDVVPVTQLVAAVYTGGLVLGAFDGETLAGFAYGFAGVESGRITLHSHMLAVREGYRNLGLGYRLKLAQREFALAQGINEMTWTFDPLKGLNAHFNLSRLGVVADRYLADLYGADTGSFLHRNGTDRLWVTWRLASASVKERLLNEKPIVDLRTAITLLEVSENGGAQMNRSAREITEAVVLIEIPDEIRDSRLAEEWRLSVRRAFMDAFAAGFVAVDYARAADTEKGTICGRYVLTRELTP